MGYMALTERVLAFELVLLDLSITVPVTRLTGVEEVYRLKGVSPGRKMLRIQFRNDSGEADSIAVQTKDHSQWQQAIARCIRQHA